LEQGAVLKFVIHQNHKAERHLLGRLRFSVTADKHGWGLSLPESLAAVAATEAKLRSEAQQQLLADYFNKTDLELVKKQQAIADSKKPLPEDPGVAQRRAALAGLQKPTPEDPLLIGLKGDLLKSERQLANQRLTAAQDLVWALINSPAFLFNH
jgi:hypothetical protein